MELTVCGNIVFSSEYIKEMDGKQVIVSIPKSDIIHIEVRHGESVEKPILNIIIGIVMIIIGCSLGVSPILDFIFNLGRQQGGNGMLVAFSLPLIILGISFILPIFQKRDYLLVFIRSGRRKLAIKDCAICDIVDTAKSLGFAITVPPEH